MSHVKAVAELKDHLRQKLYATKQSILDVPFVGSEALLAALTCLFIVTNPAVSIKRHKQTLD